MQSLQLCPIHPWVAYYMHDGQLKCISAAVFSDRLRHDTQGVHAFKKEMIDHLLDMAIPVNHIFFFSDGAASQYKNCKVRIMNLPLRVQTMPFSWPQIWGGGGSYCNWEGIFLQAHLIQFSFRTSSIWPNTKKILDAVPLGHFFVQHTARKVLLLNFSFSVGCVNNPSPHPNPPTPPPISK